jgi:hypothetical protein
MRHKHGTGHPRRLLLLLPWGWLQGLPLPAAPLEPGRQLLGRLLRLLGRASPGWRPPLLLLP